MPYKRRSRATTRRPLKKQRHRYNTRGVQRPAYQVKPLRRKQFARRKDVAIFTHNSSWLYQPDPEHLADETVLTNFITINATNPLQVFKGEEFQATPLPTMQPPAVDPDIDKYIGGSGTLQRDDYSTAQGPPTIDLHEGTISHGLGPNVASMLTDYVGIDKDTCRYQSFITKSCRVTARIVPEFNYTNNGNGTVQQMISQQVVNCYIGKSVEDPEYMSSGINNQTMKELPFIQTAQIHDRRGASQTACLMSKNFSSKKMFGLVDAEDCGELEMKVTKNTSNQPVFSEPTNKGFIQIGWRSAYDAPENMQNYHLDSDGQAKALPLPRFRIFIKVTYCVQLKDPIARSNIPRPIFLGSGPWNHKTRTKYLKRRTTALMTRGRQTAFPWWMLRNLVTGQGF